MINYVREHALVPVIETGAGICHTYFDSDGDLEKGRNIVFNAKTRRVSVCNALDCLIIHKERLSDLASLCKPLSEKNVLIYADPKAYGALAGKYPESLLQPATDDSFGTEFLDYKMAIKTVDSFGSHSSLFLETQRKYNHRKRISQTTLRSRSRCRMRIHQRIYRIHRRRTIRIRGRNRYQYTETACKRSYGSTRANDL